MQQHTQPAFSCTAGEPSGRSNLEHVAENTSCTKPVLHSCENHLCSSERPLKCAEFIPLRHDLLVASVHCLGYRYGIQDLQRIPDLQIQQSMSNSM